MNSRRERRTPIALTLVATGSMILGLVSDGSVTASMRSGSNDPAFDGAAPPSTAAGALISVSSQGRFAPDPGADPALISLANGIRIDTRLGEPALPAGLRQDVNDDEPGFFVVQFSGPIDESWKQNIEAIGGRIFFYLPNYAFVVRLPAGAREPVSRLSGVTWMGAYHPAYKLSAADEMTPGRAPGSYMLMVFDGESTAPALAAITAAGGSVVETSHGRNQFIRFEVASDALPSVALVPSVVWIEPWHPMVLENVSAQWVVQTNINPNRRVWDMGIRGEGQTVSTSDSGIRTTHQQYVDGGVPIGTFGHYPTHRKLIAYLKNVPTDATITFGDEVNNAYHGTHTGCTTAGDDSPAGGVSANDGMALKSKLIFCDGGGTTFNGIRVPLDLNELFILPYTGNGGGAARIMSNSWSSPSVGDYDFQSMTVDQFMWDHKDFLLFFSNGNTDTSPTVGSPATAKDCVSIGATGNGTQASTFASYTSQGPADDGRFKPTICAPGTNLQSAGGASDVAYVFQSGTSMASPAAAGATALIRQYLTEGWYPTGAPVPANSITPSAALLKAMAVNSGDPAITGQIIPNNRIGWGRIKDDDVLFFAGDARKLALVDFTAGLLTGEFVEFQLEVVDASIPLEATVVWTDFASTPAATINLVNNLNFRATSPTATTYLGNVYSGGQSTTGGIPDAINVEECVQRNTPDLGVWTFRIEGVNVPFGPQPFALVVTGGLATGYAIVQLDQATYGAGDVVGIRVTDPNASLAAVSVTVSSDTETLPENVGLTGGNGVFTGSIPVSLDSPSGDGEIQVSDGDVITVSYNNAAAAVVTAEAQVNLSGPAITSVHATTAPDAATVTWLTTSEANSRVYYGTTPSLGQQTPLDGSLVTSHSVPVTGLVINQTYYYDVESFDNQGNGVRDDNGGLHYTFTTDLRKDVLLVIGNNTFDKKAHFDNALNTTGWSYATWEEPLGNAPRLGNLNVGLRSYKAVIWQVGLEQYPALTDAARDTLAAYNAGGARWTMISHDVAWDFCDPTSPDYSVARCTWFNNELKAIWQADPTTWSSVIGYAGDPISGGYVGGIPYTPHRAGAAGDEINPNSVGGTSVVHWRDNEATPDDIGIRFTGAGPVGNPADAVWGGQATKIVGNFFEWAHLNVGNAFDAARSDILDKTLIWLIGHDHPDVTVSAPNGGEVFVGGPVSISWTESADLGRVIASRAIYYSSNGGESWTLITSSPGVSPYSWSIAGLPNGNQYRVRVSVVDDGAPVLSKRDDSNANFTLNVPGGDLLGPVVVAGSIQVSPNPIRAPEAASLTATVTDQNTGASNVTQAEWSSGASPAPPGTGTAMSGAFGTVTVAVSATIPPNTLTPGPATLWVRGRDAAGQWGNAARLDVQVNGASTAVDDSGAPAHVFALAQNSPNPFNPTTAIRFSLAAEAEVRLAIYDVTGRSVRTLVSGKRPAGPSEVVWDGRDDRGVSVASGLYFCHLITPERTAVRKMVMLK
jgi:hypothetical protein